MSSSFSLPMEKAKLRSFGTIKKKKNQFYKLINQNSLVIKNTISFIINIKSDEILQRMKSKKMKKKKTENNQNIKKGIVYTSEVNWKLAKIVLKYDHYRCCYRLNAMWLYKVAFYQTTIRLRNMLGIIINKVPSIIRMLQSQVNSLGHARCINISCACL